MKKYKISLAAAITAIGLFALTASVLGIDIKVSWNAISDPNVVGYRVYHRPNNMADWELLYGTTANSITHSNVAYGSHLYSIKAVNQYNFESSSGLNLETNLSQVLPPAPTSGTLEVLPGTNTFVPFP